jgi:hypothetical protein
MNNNSGPMDIDLSHLCDLHTLFVGVWVVEVVLKSAHLLHELVAVVAEHVLGWWRFAKIVQFQQPFGSFLVAVH